MNQGSRRIIHQRPCESSSPTVLIDAFDNPFETPSARVSGSSLGPDRWFHTPALGNPADGVFQRPSSLQSPAVWLHQQRNHPLQGQAARPLRHPWSKNPALDPSSSAPQTQPRPPNTIQHFQQTPDAATYAQLEKAQLVPSSIKSEHETSSQTNPLPNSPSQMHRGHEFNNASNARHLYSPQSPQLSPLSQTSQLPSRPPFGTPHSQPPFIEDVVGHNKESPTYVNAKQYQRIMKRRVVKQQIVKKLKHMPQTGRPYQHESRHQHAARRPRGPGGRFLTKDALEGQGKEVQNGRTDESQIPKTRIGSSADHAKEENADWTIGMQIKLEGGEQTEEVRDSSQDKEINEAMTTSFYEVEELEALQEKFSFPRRDR